MRIFAGGALKCEGTIVVREARGTMGSGLGYSFPPFYAPKLSMVSPDSLYPSVFIDGRIMEVVLQEVILFEILHGVTRFPPKGGVVLVGEFLGA